MAGIGVKLNNIYGKNTLTTDLIGIGYSTVVTIEPMLAVIGALTFMEYFLDFSSVELYHKGTFFLYGALYLHFRSADGLAIQLGALKIHVGCDL